MFIYKIEQIYILIFINNLIITGKNINKLQEVKVRVGKYFSYTNISNLLYFLGIYIVRDRSNRTLSIF